MCGIVAVVCPRPPERFRELVEGMTATLVHRGPDEGGVVVSERDGVGLGSRRLSVLDHEGGHQPMWDEDEERCVVFNGEIYNAHELRTELERLGHRFRTAHSDTEVLVHGFEEWGLGLPERLNGMFAFAVWDRPNSRLVVARDRAGEKPLYVARLAAGGFAVASELKALLHHPGVSRDVDPRALEEYLSFDFVLGPRTMLARVEKLPAAAAATITVDAYEPRPYWSPRFAEIDGPAEGLLPRFDDLLDSAVELRMVADVPVGLLLSGGLDSTTVGYFMRRHSDLVRSYSIGFEEAGFDESRYSELAARHLGTEHHLEVFSQARVLDLVPRIAEVLDEPMGDQSILPTYLLSTVAREEVTVALGGDGSDELLMGYDAFQVLRTASRADVLPAALRGRLAAVARRVPDHVGPVRLRGLAAARRLDERTVPRLFAYLGAFGGDARHLLAPSLRGRLGPRPLDAVEGLVLDGLAANLAPENQAIAAYLRGYLQEDILVKVDRASMATSLEVRAPFLDPRLLDFLLAVPPALKVEGGVPKSLLRRLMRGRLPDELIDRPKAGFAVPLDSWLLESLAPLVDEYLAPSRLAAAGIFDPGAVRTVVGQHRHGRLRVGRGVWLLLQFELWRERWLS